MNRDRFMYERGRGDFDMEMDMRGRGGLRDNLDRGGPMSSGSLLGERPGAPRGGGLMQEPPSHLGRSAPDPLTVGLHEQIMNHKRLEEKLSLRESQLAIASNLLQQQSQMLGDINPIGPPGGMGPPGRGLMGPAPGPPIPSLLNSSVGRPGPPKRPNEEMRMDIKRSRFDDRGPPGHPNDRRDHDRPGMMGSDYDPEFPTADRLPSRGGPKSRYFCHACNEDCFNEPGFSRHMRSKQHEDRLRGVSEMAQSNMARNQAQRHINSIERNDDDWCKICAEPMRIPPEKHFSTSIHRKRVVQVKMGCRWCNVHNFANFKEVLNHRSTRKHIENEKRSKDLESKDKSGDRRDKRRQDDDVKIGDRKYSDRGRNRNKDRNSARGKGGDKKDTKSSSRDIKVKDEKKNGATKSTPKPVEKDKIKEKETQQTALKTQLDTSKKDLTEIEASIFDANKVVGSNLVIPVTGFFCKLCHKFYNNEEAAKVGHCKTQVHFDKYKVTMTAKLKKKSDADAKALEDIETEITKLKAEKAAKEEAVKKEKEEAEAKKKSAEEVVVIEDDADVTNETDMTLEDPTDIELSSAEPVEANGTQEDLSEDTTEVKTDADDTADDQMEEGDDNQEQADVIENEDETNQEEGEENVEGIPEEEPAVAEESVEDEGEGVKEEDTSVEETTTKSPRGRARTGKPRGGKAKRGKKF